MKSQGGLKRSKNAAINIKKQPSDQAFLNLAEMMVLAYYVGKLKPKEAYYEGFARALNYRNDNGYFRALAHAFQSVTHRNCEGA